MKTVIKISLTAFGAISLFACTVPEYTFMTYNVGAFGKYTNSTGMIARMVNEFSPDALGLQELDSCNRRHDTYQLADLVDSLAWSGGYEFAKALDFAGGSYGIGCATREREVKNAYTLLLSKFDGAEARALAVLETEDFVYATTHLDNTSENARLGQYSELMHFMDSCSFEKPVFLCGDFNSAPDSPFMQEVFRRWVRLTGDSYTYDSRNPHICIDYIFALKSPKYDFKAEEVRADFNTGEVTEASDRLPLITKVKVLRAL